MLAAGLLNTTVPTSSLSASLTGISVIWISTDRPAPDPGVVTENASTSSAGDSRFDNVVESRIDKLAKFLSAAFVSGELVGAEYLEPRSHRLNGVQTATPRKQRRERLRAGDVHPDRERGKFEQAAFAQALSVGYVERPPVAVHDDCPIAGVVQCARDRGERRIIRQRAWFLAAHGMRLYTRGSRKADRNRRPSSSGSALASTLPLRADERSKQKC